MYLADYEGTENGGLATHVTVRFLQNGYRHCHILCKKLLQQIRSDALRGKEECQCGVSNDAPGNPHKKIVNTTKRRTGIMVPISHYKQCIQMVVSKKWIPIYKSEIH